MALTDNELATVRRLDSRMTRQRPKDRRLDAYYQGSQRLEHIGLAVPPELQRFETVLNVPLIAVREPEHRMDIKALLLPGEVEADEELLAIAQRNNLEAQASLVHTDMLVYGRAIVTLAKGGDGKARILAEDPTWFAYEVDPAARTIRAALRVFVDEHDRRTAGTLYLPGETIHLTRERGKWVESDYGRDQHGRGAVPVYLFLNRQRTGDWMGTSEMEPVIGLTDGIARTITNMQIAAETSAIPQKYVVGATAADFKDKDGKQLTTWESYFSSVWAIANEKANVGNLTPASLSNFHDTVNNMFTWCASVLGLPLRYTGHAAANPAAEGAIRADESRLVKNVERKTLSSGAVWGWVFADALRMDAGREVEGNRVRVEWFDPGTPTYAQRADALSKLAGGVPILSREGVWDELGFSPARKAQEREWFADQESDPLLERTLAKLDAQSNERSQSTSG